MQPPESQKQHTATNLAVLMYFQSSSFVYPWFLERPSTNRIDMLRNELVSKDRADGNVAMFLSSAQLLILTMTDTWLIMLAFCATLSRVHQTGGLNDRRTLRRHGPGSSVDGL
jgi:hypothetical protein